MHETKAFEQSQYICESVKKLNCTEKKHTLSIIGDGGQLLPVGTPTQVDKPIEREFIYIMKTSRYFCAGVGSGGQPLLVGSESKRLKIIFLCVLETHLILLCGQLARSPSDEPDITRDVGIKSLTCSESLKNPNAPRAVGQIFK